MLFSCKKNRLNVSERISAALIETGYNITESDSTFEFKKHGYLIKTREYFGEDKMLSRISILKSEGYLEFSKEDFSKLTNFVEKHGFSKSLEVYFTDDNLLRINGKSFVVKEVDRVRNVIFYLRDGDNVNLSYLVYR